MAESETLPAPKATKAELRAAADVILDRLQFMRQAGVSFNGDRDLYDALGYDRILTVDIIRARYARGGIAGRVVDALPKATWRGGLELVEDENPKTDTEFEKQWKAFDKRLKVVPKLQRVDILSGLSSYAVLLIGADGELNTELPRGKGNPDDITSLAPFAGGLGPQWTATTNRAGYNSAVSTIGADAVIEEFELDVHSERFGLPKFYRLKRIGLDSPALGVPVHWSRIIHVAEELLDDEVFSAPSLERVWNLLDDLDKLTGGGAEAFWLRANQGLHVNVDKDFDFSTVDQQGNETAEMTALKAEIARYVHRMQRVIKTQGTEVNTLGSDVADFSTSADAVLTQIAGAKAIPKRILTGSEMGELASSQDRENWRDQVVGRREGYAEPMIVRQLVDRLIDYNYLVAPKKPYLVRFAAITTMTEEEKAAGALKWASTNKMAGMPTFTIDQIRDYWYGFEPLTPEEVEKNTIAPPQPAIAGEGEGEKKFSRAAEEVVTPAVDLDTIRAAMMNVIKDVIPEIRELMLRDMGAPEEEIVRLLAAAIENDNLPVIEAITGMRTAGGPGSGNYGHAGRPGEVGGSAPADSGGGGASGGGSGRGSGGGASSGGAKSTTDSNAWKSSGGFEHTGITWKQPVDEKTGRAIPIKVNTVEEAAEHVLNGLVVEVKDVRSAHTLIDKLAKMAAEAKAAGKEAKEYDLCQVTVAGSNMFCTESLRSEQYPQGVPRIEMPQLGGKAVPGSEADKLPKTADGEVDGSQQFITFLQGIGVKTNAEQVPASNLRASQRELVGTKVGGMMTAKTYDPGKKPIFVSNDNYVVDGHHRWAAVVGRDAEDGKLGDSSMNVIRVNAPISEVLHLANAWSKKFGIAQKAAVNEQSKKTGLLKTAEASTPAVVVPNIALNITQPKAIKRTIEYAMVEGQMRPISIVEEGN